MIRLKPAASSQAAAWIPLRQAWAAGTEELGQMPQVRWWLESGHLVWEMKTPLPLAESAAFKAEGFVEGLWEQDVAEFFISDRRTGHYQEFNLSPGGAWWSALFVAPRVRKDPQPESQAFGVRTEILWTATEWVGRLSFPQPDLFHTAVNFTAITAGREGRRFYSLAALGSATPDFHRPEDWITL